MNTQINSVSRINDGTRHEDDHLTETQAREQELPMSLAWYRRMRVLGGGPPFTRISNRVFYRRGDLRAFMAGRRVQ